MSLLEKTVTWNTSLSVRHTSSWLPFRLSSLYPAGTGNLASIWSTWVELGSFLTVFLLSCTFPQWYLRLLLYLLDWTLPSLQDSHKYEVHCGQNFPSPPTVHCDFTNWPGRRDTGPGVLNPSLSTTHHLVCPCISLVIWFCSSLPPSFLIKDDPGCSNYSTDTCKREIETVSSYGPWFKIFHILFCKR